MKHTRHASSLPTSCSLSQATDVDDVRPCTCIRCRCLSRDQGRVVIQGHGIRTRLVVVLSAFLWSGDTRLVECWERRYRCTSCGAVMVVLPPGVRPRFLYSIGAIILALILSTPAPFGEGLSQGEAYERQGMYWRRPTRRTGEPAFQWRSLRRWGELVREWWPDSMSVRSLLVVLRERAGSEDPRAMVEVAVASHLQWGAAR